MVPSKYFLVILLKAGIKEDNLLIALEPEAASMFCKYMPVEKGEHSFQSFQPGSKYMVLDCGGKLIKITTYDGIYTETIA